MDNEAQNSDLNDTLEEMKEVRKSQEVFEKKYADMKKLLAETPSETEVLKELLGHATRAVTEIIENLQLKEATGHGLISMLNILKNLQLHSVATLTGGEHKGEELLMLRSKKPQSRGSQVCPFGNEDHDHPKD